MRGRWFQGLTELGIPKIGNRPVEGLMLKTPLQAAGIETDPPVTGEQSGRNILGFFACGMWTYRCQSRILKHCLSMLELRPRLCLPSVSSMVDMARRMHDHRPPELPPEESSWFRGFQWYPRMLLFVSPNYRGQLWSTNGGAWRLANLPIRFAREWSRRTWSREEEQTTSRDHDTLAMTMAPRDWSL